MKQKKMSCSFNRMNVPRMQRIDSALVFSTLYFFFFVFFFIPRSHIFIHSLSHTYSNGILQFFLLKNSAYYLRHTIFVRRNTTYHLCLYAMQLNVCACVWGMVAVCLLTSVRCIMNNNSKNTKMSCIFRYEYKVNAINAQHTHRHTKRNEKETQTHQVLRSFNRFQCRTFKNYTLF